MGSFLFLIIRILASPVVNVFQKKLIHNGFNPVYIAGMSYLFFSLLSVPYLIITQSFSFPGVFWYSVVSLAILDALGNIFLVRSLENVDLSIFGPLNAYKPMIAIILSVFLIQEVPTPMGILGILVIFTGSYLLGKEGDKNHHESFLKLLKSRGIGFRFLSIVFTSVAAVISKKVILLSDPLTTISYWSVLGLPVVITYYLRVRKGGYYKNLIWNGKQVFLTGGLLFSFLLLQITSLYTFKFIQVGYSLALFQLSAVISLFFGMKLFQEKNIRYRLSGTLVMITGAVIIILFG